MATTAVRIACLLLLAVACRPATYDVVIRGGTIYDGTGAAPTTGDVAIAGDTIAAIAPGFINMLSWATEALLVDGRSQSDIRQGVTLEVFGEGWSMGPGCRRASAS